MLLAMYLDQNPRSAYASRLEVQFTHRVGVKRPVTPEAKGRKSCRDAARSTAETRSEIDPQSSHRS